MAATLRLPITLLLALLLALTLATASPIPPRVYEVAAPLLAAGDNFSYESMESLNPNLKYDLVLINGQMKAVVELSNASGSAWKTRILDDSAEIERLLAAHFSAIRRSGQAQELLESAHAQMRTFRTRRADGNESMCKRYVGIDRNPCDSFATCQYACYSVTSLCYPVVIGAGRDFVNAIWQFSNQSHAMDAALADEERQYEALKQNFSLDGLTRYQHTLRAIETGSADGPNTPLALTYGFCPPPAYNVSAAQAADEAAGQAIWLHEPVERVDYLANWMSQYAKIYEPKPTVLANSARPAADGGAPIKTGAGTEKSPNQIAAAMTGDAKLPSDAPGGSTAPAGGMPIPSSSLGMVLAALLVGLSLAIIRWRQMGKK